MLEWLGDTGPTLAAAFQSAFSVEPREFGSPSLPIGGVSDGAEGVQWSMELDRRDGQQRMLVNLEGMAYSDWPVAHLILNELQSPRLLGFRPTGFDSAPIIVSWRRDYWQVTARPTIRERDIAPTPLRLRDLSEELWRHSLCGALGCLDGERARKGRATQHVTLERDGSQVKGPVSPHLQILYSRAQPLPWLDFAAEGRAALQGIYDWARTQAGT